jgi:hypothetical protein
VTLHIVLVSLSRSLQIDSKFINVSDGVTEGPGINDNVIQTILTSKTTRSEFRTPFEIFHVFVCRKGSGSAANLEIALAVARGGLATRTVCY